MKKSYRFGLVASVLFVVILTVGYVSQKSRIIDPNNPSFSESSFRLRNYRFNTLAPALEILIPAGTPKERVDKILVEYGGAKVSDQTKIEPGRYVYGYKPLFLYMTPGTWRFLAYFDSDKKLKSLSLGPEQIIGHSPTTQNKDSTR